MKKNLVLTEPITSSFLSCQKDTETILKRLFVQSKPYSEFLVRLLTINAHDCLDTTNPAYNEIVSEMSLPKLMDEKYIRLIPKIRFPEHEDIKSYIIMSYDGFTPNLTNPQFRDNFLTFEIICHTDYWDIGDYQVRPLKIAGYIDGLLDNQKFSGIGTLQFAGCKSLLLDENLSGYTLSYYAVHGSDDQIEPKEEK